MLETISLSCPNRFSELSAVMNKGECWHLLGPNGSGKSSFLSAISGTLNTDGKVLWNKELLNQFSLHQLAVFRCMLPQQHGLYFEVAVKECFYMLHQVSQIPTELIDYLALSSLIDKSMFTLSGGELQRVYIALHLTQVWSAIENGDALVLLDEPTQQLDPYFQTRTLDLITSIVNQGNLVIQSHHDINQTINYATHTMLIKNGKAIFQGQVEDVINANSMQSLYNQSFIEISENSTEKRYLVVK